MYVCVWSLNEPVGVPWTRANNASNVIRDDFFFWNDDMRFLYLHPHYVTNKLKEFIIHALLLARIEHVNISWTKNDRAHLDVFDYRRSPWCLPTVHCHHRRFNEPFTKLPDRASARRYSSLKCACSIPSSRKRRRFSTEVRRFVIRVQGDVLSDRIILDTRFIATLSSMIVKNESKVSILKY